MSKKITLYNNINIANQHNEISVTGHNRENIIHLSNYIALLEKAKDPSDFHRKIVTAINDLGFTDYAFTQLNTAEDLDYSLLTVSKQQMDIYKAEAFFEHDMIVQYSTSNVHPMYQSSIENYVNSAPFVTKPIEHNRELFKMLKSFGFFEYYIIPIEVRPNNSIVSFSVSINNAESVDVKRAVGVNKIALKSLGESIFVVANRKFPGQFIYRENSEVILSASNVAVLQAFANGCKTAQQVADTLNLSVNTVNYHLDKSADDLGVKTKYQAFVRAAELGLITTKYN
jgi:DNA-binding CsgD family transcriptional regulator